jgi:uncharacterized RDD family membrane protein YckC
MYCSKCGNALSAGTAFCQTCGAPVSAPSPAAIAAPGAIGTPAVAGAPQAGVSPHWLPTPSRVYAGFWLRFVAHLIDGAITGLVLCALLIPIALAGGLGSALRGIRPGQEPDPAVIFAFISSLWILILAGILGAWLYYAYCESSQWQATPGKKVLNLIVTDLNGNRVTFARASGRFFAKMISSLIPLGIGYMLAGFTEKKQALHDMIASCLVLRS